jgi:hypothetical protein
MTWAYLIVMVVVLILGIALAPKAQGPNAAEIDDFDFPTAEEGRPIPVVFGEVDIRGSNILWYGDLRVQAIKKRSGFSKSTVGHKYYIGWHSGLCHGPVDAITNILVGEKQAWSGNATSNTTISINSPDLFGGEKREGGISGAIDVCMGGPTQTANSYLSTKLASAYPGIPVTAFRGITCLVVKQAYIGTSAYPKVWAVRTRRILEGWQDDITWYDTKAVVDTRHMNPAHIVYQCLTDNRWGMGVDFSLIDETSFQAVADKLHAENFGMSVIWNQSESIEKFIQIILDHIAGGLTLNNSTGKYEMLLVRGDYDIETLDEYDESDVVRVTDYQRQGWGETVNEVTLVYTDPKTRKDTTISQQDLANIDAQGARVPQIIKLKGIHNHDVAKTVLARELVSRVTPLSKVVFEVNRRAWATRYGGLFKLFYSPRNIDGTVYRVLKVSKGTLTKNSIKIEALEDIYALGVNSSLATPTDPPDDEDAPPTPDDAVDTGVNVISTSQTTPPVTPADGDSYFIPGDGTATGVWAGHEGEVADYDLETDEWIFTPVPDNTLVFDEATNSWQTIVGGVAEDAPWVSSALLTTKGDLIGHDGTAPVRIPAASSDGLIPYSDAASPGGILWDDPPEGGGGEGTGALIYSDASVPATNIVANTTTETTFSSKKTFTPSMMAAGVVIRFEATGTYSTDGAVAPTLRLRAKLGATTILDTTAFTTTVAMTNRGWSLRGVAMITTSGASGLLEAQGQGNLSTSATAAQTVFMPNTAKISVDTTANRDLTVTAQWGTADTDNTITMRQLLVYSESTEGLTVQEPVALLHFNGADASTDMVDVLRKQWNVAGNAQLDTAQFKFGTSSLYLDGTGDYVTSMPDEDFVFGTGDFTIECWVRFQSRSGNHFVFTWGAGWGLYTRANAWSVFDGAASEVIVTVGTVANDIWYHVVVTRQSGNLRLFVDGVQLGSTVAHTTNHTNGQIRIGAQPSGSGTMNGWVDDFRVHRFGLYTTGFTPPSVAYPDPTAPIFYERALLHFNGVDGSTTFTDETGRAWTRVAASTCEIDTAQSQFGGASLLLGGSGNYLTSPDTEDMSLAASNFTVEGWVRFASVPSTGVVQAFVTKWTTAGSNRGWSVSLFGGNFRLLYSTTGSDAGALNTAWSPAANTWYHFAVVRYGNNVLLFINGALLSTQAFTATIYDSTALLQIGTQNLGIDGELNGWLDDIRITPGHAKYVQAFTVPQVQFLP